MRRRIAESGHPVWFDSLGPVEVRFVGRGPGDRASAAVAAGAPAELAWLRQVHSARVLEAAAGSCGEGDALISRLAGLALSVVTADCVPLLLAGDGEIAAIHAGWRGIAAGVVSAAVDQLDTSADRLTAWLGPAIGPCCYEVSDEVAAEVAATSGPAVVRPGRADRPHLDLHEAVALQLRQAGAAVTRRVRDCTRCCADLLCSYRREGPGAGRNVALVWRLPRSSR